MNKNELALKSKTNPMLKRFSFVFMFLISFTVITKAQSDSCGMPSLPSVEFNGRSMILSQKAKLILNDVASLVKFFPKYKIKVAGHINTVIPSDQQVSWDRVSLVMNYLKSRGMKAERFIFDYGQEGPMEYVDLIGTMEDGPATVPMAMPCFSIFTPKAKRCVDKNGNFKGTI